jgi:hypothetical protein
MPVVINDFEVVVEPPSRGPRESESEQAEQDARRPRLRPEDIHRIVRHFQQRRARVRAD